MTKKIYSQRKTMEKYDNSRYLLYLNERIIEDYVPETQEEGGTSSPITAYEYEGEEPDAGTFVNAVSADRDSLINGLIRTRYSQTAEDAIKTHQIEIIHDPGNAKVEEYLKEWDDFNAFRNECIKAVDKILSSMEPGQATE